MRRPLTETELDALLEQANRELASIRPRPLPNRVQAQRDREREERARRASPEFLTAGRRKARTHQAETLIWKGGGYE